MFRSPSSSAKLTPAAATAQSPPAAEAATRGVWDIGGRADTGEALIAAISGSGA